MIMWAVLGVAVVGYLACYRVTYRFFDNDDVFGGDDSADKVMTVVTAILVSFFWPLALLGFGLWLFVTPTTARERRAQIEEMEKRKQQLQDDIAELERQTREGHDR